MNDFPLTDFPLSLKIKTNSYRRRVTLLSCLPTGLVCFRSWGAGWWWWVWGGGGGCGLEDGAGWGVWGWVGEGLRRFKSVCVDLGWLALPNLKNSTFLTLLPLIRLQKWWVGRGRVGWGCACGGRGWGGERVGWGVRGFKSVCVDLRWLFFPCLSHSQQQHVCLYIYIYITSPYRLKQMVTPFNIYICKIHCR